MSSNRCTTIHGQATRRSLLRPESDDSRSRHYFVQLNFIWDKEHGFIIRKIYDHRMARRLQQMLEDVHERRDHFTTWLHPKIKKALYIHWETNERFRHRRLTNRVDRVSARLSKYIGGSASFMKTKSKSLDHDATLTETFKYTHLLKENKERFVDQRSRDHYVSKHLILLYKIRD
nr:uncharacterized protein LOC114924138 [Arachis hypogaea]